MSIVVARLLMALATASLDEDRRDWASAMKAEFAAAAEDGAALPFAAGCLVAGWRATLTGPRGHFVLTNYGLALAVMLPMAALQIGCGLLGLPYLYPGRHGLAGALLEGGAHENLLRGVYQAAVPSLALLQVVTGIGHLRLAWLLLERDWPRAWRAALQTLAAAATLILFMGALFLDSRQAMMQAAVVGVELGLLALIVSWHAGLSAPAAATRTD